MAFPLPRLGKLINRAVAAGGGSAPVEAPSSLAAPLVEIPADWEYLNWPKLRSLATALGGDAAINTKADAIRRIEAELKRRA